MGVCQKSAKPPAHTDFLALSHYECQSRFQTGAGRRPGERSTIHKTSIRMVGAAIVAHVLELRAKSGDSEKINLGYVDWATSTFWWR